MARQKRFTKEFEDEAVRLKVGKTALCEALKQPSA